MTKINRKLEATFHQIVLLDMTGIIRYSCETLLPLKQYKNKSLLEVSPFLESIHPQLFGKQHDTEKTLRYYKLDDPFPGLEGTYDFTFQRVIVEKSDGILWNIYDLSEVYQSIREAQQKHNENAISAEKLAALSRKDLNNWKKSNG